MNSCLLDAPAGQVDELRAENARLRAEVEALRGRNEVLASAVAWFRDGLEDDDAREVMTRRMCEEHVVPQVAGNAGAGRSTASPTPPCCPSASSSPLSLGAVAAVLAAEQMPSALSERQLAAAAVACRAVVTLGR